MGTDKRQRFSPPAIGGTSLLVVFAVLCLTVFALLSLTTVQADVRLADASAKAVEDYYAADCRAQTVLAYLRAGQAVPETISEDLTITTKLTEYADRSGDRVNAYAIPISDTRELQVEVRMEADGGYTILRWQAVPTGEWAGNEALDLWDGTE